MFFESVLFDERISLSLFLNFRSADIGCKSDGKSITVVATGIGHLVYPGRIRRRTEHPEHGSILGNGPALSRRRSAVILFAHSTCAITHVDFSLRVLPIAVSRVHRVVGVRENNALAEREKLISECDIVRAWLSSRVTVEDRICRYRITSFVY